MLITILSKNYSASYHNVLHLTYYSEKQSPQCKKLKNTNCYWKSSYKKTLKNRCTWNIICHQLACCIFCLQILQIMHWQDMSPNFLYNWPEHLKKRVQICGGNFGKNTKVIFVFYQDFTFRALSPYPTPSRGE